MRLTSILIICVVSLSLEAVSPAQEKTGPGTVASIILQQAKYLSNIHSVEYTIVSGNEGGNSSSKAHWKEMGPLYRLDYSNSNKRTKTDFKLLVGYDGENAYDYLPSEDVMFIQKAPFAKYDGMISDFIFDGPFRAFQFLARQHVRIGLNELQSDATFQAVLKRATPLPENNKSWYGHPCIAIKIADGYDPRTHNTVDYVVYFATDCEQFPIAWEMFSKEGKFLEGYSIVKFKTIPISGLSGKVALRFPERACTQSGLLAQMYKDRGIPMPSIEDLLKSGSDPSIALPEIKINGLEKSDFTVDPAIARHINDLDSKINIVVPK